MFVLEVDIWSMFIVIPGLMIYHEHVDYHTVAPFEKLFAELGWN